MRPVVWRLGLVLLVAGCSSTSPPSPPLAEPMAEGPREYAWPALRWSPSTQLSYRLETFTEKKVGDDVERGLVQQTVRFEGRERTAEGRSVVGVRVGDVELAILLFDEAGRLHDAVEAKGGLPPALRQLVWALGLTTRHFAGRALAVNERYATELSPALLRLLIARSGSEPPDSLVAKPIAEVEFTGYRRLGGRITVGLRGTTPNLLRRAVTWEEGGVPPSQVDYLSSEWTDYLDATAGTLVSRYWVTTLGGEADGRRFTRRQVSSLVLDR